MLGDFFSWVLREPLYRTILFLLYVVDVVSNVLRYIGCLNDRRHFTAQQQEFAATKLLNSKGISNTTYDDKFHLQNMSVVLPELWNDWYIYGRLFPTMFIQPSLERKRMVEITYNRLQESSKKHNSLPPAIFVVGMPRTGSTFFHKLLALDDTTYSPKQWELKFPTTITEDDEEDTTTARMHEAKELNDWTYRMMPRLSKIHNVGASDPDECVIGFVDCAFPEYYLWGCRNMPLSYQYYLKSTMKEQYKNYRKQLVVSLHDACVNGQRQDRDNTSHVVLKSPHHTCKIKTIADVFPDSVFVWLHRPLSNVVASTCSMNETLNDYSDVSYESRERLGKRTLQRLAEVMDIGVRDREELTKSTKSNKCKFVDVYYEDLVKNPIETIKYVYKNCGKRCSRNYIERLENYLRDDAERRKQQSVVGNNKRRHKYALKDFSLDKKDVEKAFATYCAKYKMSA